MIRPSQGFTLFEILIVLAMLSMAYALVPPLFSVGGSTTELKAAARQLAAGLRKSRIQAISDKKEAVLTVDVNARRFQVMGESKSRSLPAKVQLTVFTAQSEVSAENVAKIRFFPDGSSTGGRITLAMGARKFLVDVDWLTGKVVILDGE